MPNRNWVPQSHSEHTVPAFTPPEEPKALSVPGLPEPETVPTGTLLINQGEHPTSVCLISSGIVKFDFTSEGGDPITLGLRSSGWWINADLALLSLPSLCAVRTITDCELIKLSIPEFTQRIFSDSLLIKEQLLAQYRELLIAQQRRVTQGRSAVETHRPIFVKQK